MRCIIIFSSNNLVKTLAVYAFSGKEILPMQVLQKATVQTVEIRDLCFLPNESHPSKETVRKTNVIRYWYMWKLKKKKIQMNLFTKQKQTHRLTEQTYDF